MTLESEHLQVSSVRVPTHAAAAIPLADPVDRRADTPLRLVLPGPHLAAARAAASGLGGSADPVERQWRRRGGRRVDAVDPERIVVSRREPL
ncbi:hypothetical protein [Longivirga aurantiaca]|uniref:Uncharacterized protein n=1 Tax=Longivirga aurantiaca TaxID=1837743 RepID=A0ABW1T1B7_9ACTN